MNNDDDLLYKKKYIKYKNKYINLKNIEQLGGVLGVTSVDGIMCFFTSSELANKVKDMLTSSKSIKLDEIKATLHNQAYVIEDGGKNLELVLKSTLPFKKPEPLPDKKVLKVPTGLSVFNRCEGTNRNQVKSILSPHKFYPESMLVVNIHRSSPNQFMNIISL